VTIYTYDAEFLERGHAHPISLISLGMVHVPSGNELYFELKDAPWTAIRQHPWLMENVIPHLNGERITRATAATKLQHFWIENGWPTQFWGYFVSYDHVVLSQIFGTMLDLPANVPQYSHDIKTKMDDLGIPNKHYLPIQEGTEHNALEDARWNAAALLYLQKIEDDLLDMMQ
jgi:hypothetical protein